MLQELGKSREVFRRCQGSQSLGQGGQYPGAIFLVKVVQKKLQDLFWGALGQSPDCPETYFFFSVPQQFGEILGFQGRGGLVR
jgi:hypothetical protein